MGRKIPNGATIMYKTFYSVSERALNSDNTLNSVYQDHYTTDSFEFAIDTFNRTLRTKSDGGKLGVLVDLRGKSDDEVHDFRMSESFPHRVHHLTMPWDDYFWYKNEEDGGLSLVIINKHEVRVGG